MLDSMLESTGKRNGKRTLGPVGLSALVHITVVVVVVGVSYLVVGAVQAPPGVLTFVNISTAPLQASPPPRPPLPRAAAESQVRDVEHEIEPEEILQPIEVPDEVPTGPETPEDAGILDGDPWGDPDGTPEGVRGGVPQGVLDGTGEGDPDGMPSGTGEEPIVVRGDMIPPRLIHKPRPEYPEVLRRARLEGRVFLQAVIAKDGTVVDVTVLRSTSPLFEDAALSAVRQWRYEPALSGGQPVAVYFTVIVDFRLE